MKKKRTKTIQKNRHPLILAHRGDSCSFPENTMLAFKNASKMKVDVIETDVHLSADGEVVIWHDDNLERFSGDKRAISKMKWDEIKKINAGALFSNDGGVTFPFRYKKNINPLLLKDVLTKFPNMSFNVDLKDNNKELAEKYAQIIKEYECEKRVTTASFHPHVLLHFRKMVPQALSSCTSAEVLKLLILYKIGLLRLPLNFKTHILQVPEYSGKIKVLSKGFIKFLHKRNFQVQVWTINDVREMERFIDLGVDGIFTDKPKLLFDCLKKRMI